MLAHWQSTSVDSHPRLAHLEHTIEHLSHLLPAQAPIRVFVHHNTLHAFEDQTFYDAVKQGSATYGCHAYLPEDRYRQKLARGRILPQDLAAALLEDPGEEPDRLIGFLGTRYHLRLAMLQHPLRLGPDAELRWLIAEADALRRFRDEAPVDVKEQMIDQTRRWVMRDLRNGAAAGDERIRRAVAVLFDRFGGSKIERWSEATWEAFTLQLLWYTCHHGVHGVQRFAEPLPPLVCHRDFLLHATGTDTDRYVNDVLIRFCAAFLDQGIARWTLPSRERGFLASFFALNRDSRPVDRWLRGLPTEIKRLEGIGYGALEIIAESLYLLGVDEAEEEAYLSRMLLALRGWTGMLWQMETNAEWAVHPAPTGTLVEYLAARLILERLAIDYFARAAWGNIGPLSDLRSRLRKGMPRAARVSVEQRAFLVFQLAQTLGWMPADLYRMSKGEWSNLVEEIESFSASERRRIYHLAFERRYRNQALDAIAAHARRAMPTTATARFQVVCCIDEREESFRRHLEEIARDCETFSVAGFFGVAMYYRGAADAHFVPLCPVVVKPRHYVVEEVVYSFEQSHRRRTETRRALGKASHRLHTGSRSGLAGAATALLGTLASIPLVARVLFPRLTARILRLFGSFVEPPPITRLLMERTDPEPGSKNGGLGYSLDEMVTIAECVLQDIGLTARFSRLVFVTGHGSSSLNNPHESAHDCGACGGGRGGPNARAFAAMLSDLRVRERLERRGLAIPRETVFIGAYHNTCDDSIQFYDLDRLPSSHHEEFERAKAALDEARRRNAHERCRRFESAELSMSPEAALRHVEGRAEDLSQVRPEYGHATNAICFVGRRLRTKGLFLDRRTFLTSYDPTRDDQENAILTRILQAVIPVCAGINLEYYFSYVDPTGYGCGTKLPHNITSLLGVMDGAASDLRSGLPWQMVEIHEPVRILFVIETTPQAMRGIFERNPALAGLVRNDWVQLATIDPDSPAIQLYRNGGFEPYRPETTELPVVKSSVDWYRGWRDHLGFASIADVNKPCGAAEEIAE
ncbi:MAG: DUF2309 domain-containing protein [Planctomycetia bacterium]|nr:DUF2309 domain-containing protein [Planctomycetia bacterium]